ncbi:MAG: acetoacetate--CoA ligase, partial [Acidimicrobiia bacterium]
MSVTSLADVLWEPSAEIRENCRIGRYMAWLKEERGRAFEDYQSLWEWSVSDLDGFWASLWDYFGIMSSTPYEAVIDEPRMPGARWFAGATLNLGEHIMRGAHRGAAAQPDAVMVRARSQTRGPVDLTAAQLEEQVGRARAGLVRLGVGPGDRVAAYMPNIPETVAVYLATISLGAIWSSCAPEFGVQAVVGRLSQIAPRALFVVDGYRFGSKPVDRTEEVATIRGALPSVETVVALPYLYPDEMRIPDALGWAEFSADAGPATFDRFPFDHPLHVLFSSGTTGLPKPIVHGHGGVLVDQMKTHAFHLDVGPGDRMFFFCTTGWVAWNWLISALALGSGVVLFDGNPMFPDLRGPWQLASETGVTFYASSPGLMMATRREGIVPRQVADLSAVRCVVSSGAPLPLEGFGWIYEAVGPDVYFQSLSGGTEIAGAFVGGVPILPSRAGEITTRWLGCDVQAFDDDGRSLVGSQGELVLTKPLPSMPIRLWGDDDGSRLRRAFFDRYPGVWCHGDWITFTEGGASMITGRSDATLNRGGVRLGTAEFYS